MMIPRSLLTVFWLGLAAPRALAADGPNPPTEPPWQRVLSGADALRARELTKRLDELDAAGKNEEAIKVADELLELRRRAQGRDHWEAVNLAWSQDVRRKGLRMTPAQKAAGVKSIRDAKEAKRLEDAGDYIKAEGLCRSRLAWCREALGVDHPYTATAINNLAYNLNLQARYADAGQLYEKSLEIHRKSSGETHPDTALASNNVAMNLACLGRYAEARPYVESALRISRHLYGEDDPRVALCFNNLGYNLAAQGRFTDAHVHLTTALASRRRHFGEADPDVVVSYNNLGLNLINLGRYDEAEPLLEKALAGFVKISGENHPDAAVAMSNLAFLRCTHRRFDEALPLYQKSLKIRRDSLAKGHPDTASGYNDLGMTLAALGRHDEALPLLKKALEICRPALGECHPDTASTYGNLANCYYALNRDGEAIDMAERAARGYEASRLTVASRGLDRAAFGARSPYHLLAVLRAKGRKPADAWAAVEAGLARGLLDEAVAADRQLKTEEAGRRRQLDEQLIAVRARVLALIGRGKLGEDEARALKLLGAERERLETGLADLAGSVSAREVSSMRAVQAAIPPDAALIVWTGAMADNSGSSQEHWACLLRSDGDPHWERLPGTGPGGAWTKDDTSLPGLLTAALRGGTPPAEIEDLVRRLRHQRLKPLEKHLRGVKRLIVVPVGLMSGVPVEVLADDFVVGYAPSGSVLARLKARGKPAANGILAVGDPSYAKPPIPAKTPLPPGGLLVTRVLPDGNAASANLRPNDVLLKYAGTELTSAEQLRRLIAEHLDARDIELTVWREGRAAARVVRPGPLDVILELSPAPKALEDRRTTDQLLSRVNRGRDWEELPGTAAEVAGIASLFGGRAVCLVRREASSQRIDALRADGKLMKFRYIHFATHAEANDLKEFESALVLAAPPRRDAGGPGSRSQDINGRLTAGAVLRGWRINTDLVTLSGCGTALGRPVGGDGLLGFTQAFLLAGSRSVCVSLWDVDDAATALLMERFYQNLTGLRRGLDAPMGKAAALAEAKKWLKRLPGAEAARLVAALTGGVVRGKGEPAVKLVVPERAKDSRPTTEYRPFAHPRYWAAFVLLGDQD